MREVSRIDGKETAESADKYHALEYRMIVQVEVR